MNLLNDLYQICLSFKRIIWIIAVLLGVYLYGRCSGPHTVANVGTDIQESGLRGVGETGKVLASFAGVFSSPVRTWNSNRVQPLEWTGHSSSESTRRDVSWPWNLGVNGGYPSFFGADIQIYRYHSFGFQVGGVYFVKTEHLSPMASLSYNIHALTGITYNTSIFGGRTTDLWIAGIRVNL